MASPGIARDGVAVGRILRSGFDAVAEYDAGGSLVAWAGELSSDFTWARVGGLAFSGQGQGVAEKATAMVLGDLVVAALGLEGGGTLLAIAERQVVGQAAQELARALDRAVAGVVGEKLAPWAVLAGVLAILIYVAASSAGPSKAVKVTKIRRPR